LEKLGFTLRRNEPFSQVVVPDHRELDRGTLRAILRHADIEIARSVELL
jgi:predicted RNA binding protein YcfA (HicA-like mRNA interferase family)